MTRPCSSRCARRARKTWYNASSGVALLDQSYGELMMACWPAASTRPSSIRWPTGEGGGGPSNTALLESVAFRENAEQTRYNVVLAVQEMLTSANMALSLQKQDNGGPVTMFWGAPIKLMENIVDTEAVYS